MTLPHLESFLRDRLSRPLPGPDAHWAFAPQPARNGWQPDRPDATAREAAALILLYPGERGASFPLTIRRDDLPHHPGQISLPGGRLDPGEAAMMAALREAQEEIGVDPHAIRVVGALSPLWVMVSNFIVRPFIGVIDARPAFRASAREVSALIETPVAWVRDPARIGWEERIREGVPVKYRYFEFQGHHVWGATAMMLGEFSAVLGDLDARA